MLRKLLITAGLLVAFLTTTQAGTALADVTQVNATITSVTLIDRAHAQVQGTVTCNAPATVDISVVLRQPGGPSGFREASGSAQVSCGTTPTPFSIVVTGGPLHPGPALLEANFSAFDALGQVASTRILTIVLL